MRARTKLGILVAGRELTDALYLGAEILANMGAEMQRQELRHTRHIHDLVAQFRNALEEGDEYTLRNVLDEAVSDLADTVARMEEHSL